MAVLSRNETREAATALMWIYFLGEKSGRDIKIGITKAPCIRERRVTVDSAQMNSDRYVLLAGVLGPKWVEDRLSEAFAESRADKGSRREYYQPTAELVEYILWLRQQWFVVHDENVLEWDAAEEDPSRWLPGPTHRETRPESLVLFGAHDISRGSLAETVWAWMPDPNVTYQDYFTPVDLVARASEAMGGIDLDAASHYLANKRLREAGVEIGEFFHVNKSAFGHDWHGRVWLNPPYGENERWFQRCEEMFDAGRITQLCMLSPVHAFTTRVADRMVRHSTGMILLSPTPQFFNPGEPTKTGTNLPHAIVYWGTRVNEFLASFNGVGIPFELRWSDDGVTQTERPVAV